jgi:integrase
VIRNHLLPPFGERRLEDITEQEVERWARRLGADQPLSNATKRKVIVIFHGVMARACRVYRLPVNPVATVEKPRLAAPGTIEVFSPEEIHALVRAAAAEQDAAIFLTGRRSLDCARASSWRCAGATSTSPGRTFA